MAEIQTQHNYNTRDVCTTHDIPDLCKVQALIDYAAAATHDLTCLDSDQEVGIYVYELIRPVGEFHGRSSDDIANELGSIDRGFLASKVLRLRRTRTYRNLMQMSAQGRLLLFSACIRPQSDPELAHTWTSNRRRADVPEIHEHRDILATHLVDSEKVTVTAEMFWSLVSVDHGSSSVQICVNITGQCHLPSLSQAWQWQPLSIGLSPKPTSHLLSKRRQKISSPADALHETQALYPSLPDGDAGDHGHPSLVPPIHPLLPTRGATRGSPRDDPSATSTCRATRRPTGTRGRTGQSLEIAESYELEGLIAHDVEEWRNEVRRTQDASGLRHRRGLRLGGRNLDHISTTLDESFTELTHTPINPTHVISNVSSPVFSDSLSLPSVPHSPARAHLNIRNRSGSTTTITATAVQEQELHTSQQTGRLFAIPSSPPAALPKSPDGTTEPDTDTAPPSSLTSPRLITIPPIGSPSSAFDSSPVPRSRPGYTTIERDDDSPFGPLLPDTPRPSPALYAGRPFSPIVKLTGSTSSPVVPGTEIVNSPSFSRGSSIGRRGSTLSHEIFAAEHNDNTDDVENSSSTDLGHGNTPVHSRTHSLRHTSSPRHQAPNAGVHPLDPDYTNPNSSIASLSLGYPVPPMSPVMVSPPILQPFFLFCSPRNRG